MRISSRLRSVQDLQNFLIYSYLALDVTLLLSLIAIGSFAYVLFGFDL